MKTIPRNPSRKQSRKKKLHKYTNILICIHQEMAWRCHFTTANYMKAAATYGLIRKIPEMRHAHIYEYESETRTRIPKKILLTDKIIITAWSSLTAIYLWPWYLHTDVQKCERFVRQYCDKNYHANDYSSKDIVTSEKTHIFEYILS